MSFNEIHCLFLFVNPMQKKILILNIFVILIAIFLCYWNTLNHKFVYDDTFTIENNYYIRSLSNFFNFFSDYKSTAPNSLLNVETYRPFKTLINAIEYYFWGLNSKYYHLTNIVLHSIVSILFYFITIILIKNKYYQLMTSILFAVHPALSHNVSYISARGDIIAAIFLMLTIIGIIKFGNIFGLIFCCVSFFVACFSKETVIMFPFFYLFFQFVNSRKLSDTIPFWFISFAYFVVRYLVLGQMVQCEYEQNSFIISQAIMIKAWFFYILGFFWPTHVEVIPVIGLEKCFFNFRTIIYGSILILLFSLFYIFRRRLRLFLWGFLWFVIFLIPTANLIPIKAFMSWRFVYISFIGLCLGFGCFLDNLKLNKFILVLLCGWIITLGFYTNYISKKFESNFTLWNPLLIKHSEIAKPYCVIGINYILQKDYIKAYEILNKGLKNTNNDESILFYLSQVEMLNNNYNRALELLNKISKPMQKYFGNEYLETLIYVLYNLNKDEEIVKKIDLNNIQYASINTLIAVAESSMFLKKYNLAKQLYAELLTRNLSESDRKEFLIKYKSIKI